MISALGDGIKILFEYKIEIIALLVTCHGLGLIVLRTSTTLFDARPIIILSTLPTGMIVLCGFTFLLSFASLISVHLHKLISWSVVFIGLVSLIHYLHKETKQLINIALVTTVYTILLLLKLPLLDRILLPGYTDSPIHYQIIENILDPYTTSPGMGIGNLTETYYHLGFHGLAAWIASLTGTNSANAMSLIGQLSLAAVPLSVAFATFALSKNIAGSLASGFLAAFGWAMPAFAINWGKFPALLCLSLLPAALGWGALLRDPKGKGWLVIAAISFLIASLIGTHTRSLFIFILFITGLSLVKYLSIPDTLGYPKAFLYSTLFIVSLLPLRSVLGNFYNPIILNLVLIGLLPFGFRCFPRELSALFFFTSSIWLSDTIGDIFMGGFKPFDVQFTSIMLFIPLSIAGGLGISGLTKHMNIMGVIAVTAILILAIAYNSPWRKSLIPDPCCNYYTESDERAFEWIKDETDASALFIIAAIEGDQHHGTDAGIWIHPLINRPVNKRPYNADWTNSAEFPNSCNSGENDIYIYLGGNTFSFRESQLSNIPWVDPAFSDGKVNIYRILSCSRSGNQGEKHENK
ncbi:MAG: hypothetical protein IPG44_17065 [Anaerolineales bacterium]|jgi:hypothetical protein|nr:hypothetical protein [Anaerolineales bacterium]